MLRRISSVLKSLHADKTDIAGILYFHPINDARVTGSSKKNLDMFGKVVGVNNMKRCVLVTTKWSCEQYAKAKSHEAELASNPDFWKPMFDAGVGYARYEDTRLSAMKIIEPLCEGDSMVPKVIVEWEGGKRLHETEAGRAVEDDVEQAQKLAQQDIQEAHEEAAEAIRRKDFETARAREKERKELESRLAKMEQERETLRIEYEQQRKQQEAQWEVQRKEAERERQKEIELHQRKQREEAARWEKQQHEAAARWEKAQQELEKQREADREAYEAHRERAKREYEAQEERARLERAENQRRDALRGNRKSHWVRRIGLGVLGTAAVVVTGGLAAPIVAGVATAHEVSCQEEKEQE